MDLFEHGELKRKQAPVTVLALLLGLLLGFSGSAPSEFDAHSAQLAGGRLVRSVPGLRIANRSSEERRDAEGALPLASAPPQIITELGSVRPVAEIADAAVAAAYRELRFHYRARAPPAA